MIRGLLDAADRLDPEAAAGVLDIGLDWPSPSVRLPTIQRLAATGRQAEVLHRAEGDRAERIRRWAAAHRQQTLLDDGTEPDLGTAHDPDEAAGTAGTPQASQPALFS